MKNWMANHRRELFILPWALFVAGMLAGGYFQYYVAGWHAGFQLVGLLILAFALLVGISPSKSNSHEHAHCCHHAHPPAPLSWAVGLVQLIPVFIFLAMGPTSLSASPGSMNGSAGLSAAAGRDFAKPGKKAPPAKTPDGYHRVSLLDLHESAGGKGEVPHKVQITGRMHLVSPKEMAKLPAAIQETGAQAFIYRFLIVCCAADARPLSAAVTGLDPAKVKEGGWYKLKGDAKLFGNSKRGIIIQATGLTEVKAPKPPYLIYGITTTQ